MYTKACKVEHANMTRQMIRTIKISDTIESAEGHQLLLDIRNLLLDMSVVSYREKV
jgi:hypothetical protein